MKFQLIWSEVGTTKFSNVVGEKYVQDILETPKIVF